MMTTSAAGVFVVVNATTITVRSTTHLVTAVWFSANTFNIWLFQIKQFITSEWRCESKFKPECERTSDKGSDGNSNALLNMKPKGFIDIYFLVILHFWAWKIRNLSCVAFNLIQDEIGCTLEWKRIVGSHNTDFIEFYSINWIHSCVLFVANLARAKRKNFSFNFIATIKKND